MQYNYKFLLKDFQLHKEKKKEQQKQPHICKEEGPLCLFHLEAFDLLLNPLVLLQLLLCGPLAV